MKIGMTQMDILWENPEGNKEICEKLVEKAAKEQAEMIVFPEMTLTGFTMRPECFSETGAESFFHSLANKYGIAVLFGYIEKKNDRYFNMLELTDGQKTLMKYAKIHPFSFGGESRHYTGGDQIVTASFRNVSLGGFICYDLRFPEIFQISSKSNEVIMVIANWPEKRIDHWYALLKARAIENQCFIIGVNRRGSGDGIVYKESSVAYNPYGELLAGQGQKGDLIYADIDSGQVMQYRREFPLKKDRRENIYNYLVRIY